MLYGLRDGESVEAFPGDNATCPLCGQPLIAKCGAVNVWHWAHVASADCDPWYEQESPWHVEWKSLARQNTREVKFGPHRADILGKRGVVIELQHSSISGDEIAEREAFYGDMIWMFDGTDLEDRLSVRPRGDYVVFRWKHPRKTLALCAAPVFIDLGWGDILEIKKVHESPFSGWGYRLSYRDFIDRYLIREAK